MLRNRPRSKVRRYDLQVQGVRPSGPEAIIWLLALHVLNLEILGICGTARNPPVFRPRLSYSDWSKTLLCSAQLIFVLRLECRGANSSRRCSHVLGAEIWKIFSFVRRFLIPRVMCNGTPRFLLFPLWKQFLPRTMSIMYD